MTLNDLKQIKASIDDGVLISKSTWLSVLDQAIKLQQEEDDYQKWVAESLPQSEAEQ